MATRRNGNAAGGGGGEGALLGAFIASCFVAAVGSLGAFGISYISSDASVPLSREEDTDKGDGGSVPSSPNTAAARPTFLSHGDSGNGNGGSAPSSPNITATGPISSSLGDSGNGNGDSEQSSPNTTAAVSIPSSRGDSGNGNWGNAQSSSSGISIMSLGPGSFQSLARRTSPKTHGCQELIDNFDKLVDAATVDNHPDFFRWTPRVYNPGDRVGKITACVMNTLLANIQSHPYSQSQRLIDNAKKDYEREIRSICGILRGSFSDRLRAHVARIRVILSSFRRYSGAHIWLTDEANIYSPSTRNIASGWDALNDNEADILFDLYTKAAENVGHAPRIDFLEAKLVPFLDKFVKRIDTRYSQTSGQQ